MTGPRRATGGAAASERRSAAWFGAGGKLGFIHRS